MKSKFKCLFRHAGATAFMLFAATAGAATISWNAGTVGQAGDFNDATKWVGGVAPGALSTTDIALIDNGSTATATGASTVNFLAGYDVTLTTLDLAATNVNENRPVFNQTGGKLTTGSLLLGHAAFGATRSPEYRISDGLLNIGTTWAFGDGNAIKFLATGGVTTYTGTGAFTIGNNGGNHTISLSNNAVINYNSSAQIVLGAGNANGVGTLTLSNTASFNAPTVTTILLGNDGTKGNSISLSDTASLTAPLATLALGQYIGGTATATAGTLTLGGTSNVSINTLKTGGNNAGNTQWGVVNLNGGTLLTGSIVSGASLTAADATHNVVRGNGGTVKAKAANVSFFTGVYLDLLAGGLTFDTNNNAVTITNQINGVGGLTKKGLGTLTLSNNVIAYTGNTVVSEGVLTVPTATFSNTGNVSIATGAKLTLGAGLEDEVGSLTLGGVVKPNGIYGSSASGAPLANQDDNFFAGTGTLRVGAAASARNLAWEGALGQVWATNDIDKNFLDGAIQTGFHALDNVTFGDLADALKRTITLNGTVQPTSITINNGAGNDYVFQGTGNIGGTTGLVKNGAGNVTLGGVNNTFSGAVAVNGGTLVQGSDNALGTTTSVTIASGSALDISGRVSPITRTFTIAGTGVGGNPAIFNSGVMRQGDSGIKNLVLTADASIGGGAGRFDIGQGGVLTGNNHTLTKVGANFIGFRGDASGSPIRIVIEGGTVWAEASTGAYGGATGFLTIKSGARAGTYGALTIATPVTIESGGTLHNQGLNTGTWTGAFTLAGEVTVDSAGGIIQITGPVSGTANFTKTGVSDVTLANPTYVGSTTVTGGQLTLPNANLADTQTVRLTGATSVLNLTHGNSDTIGRLFLDGVQVAAGTYVSTTNTQGIPGAIPTAHIVGNTGSLVVGIGPGPTAFESWADAAITNPNYANLKGPLDDPDGDGFNNQTEYLFGSDPQTGGGSLVQTTSVGGDLVIRWNQRNGVTNYKLQESLTLALGSWVTSTLIPAADVNQVGVPAGYTRIQVTVPRALPVKFVRVSGVD